MILTGDLPVTNNTSTTNGVVFLTRGIIPGAICNVSVDHVPYRYNRVYRTYVRVDNASDVSRNLVLLRCQLIHLAMFVHANDVSTLIRGRFNLVRVFLLPYCRTRFNGNRFNGLVSQRASLLPFTHACLPTCAINVASDSVGRVAFSNDLMVHGDAFCRISRVVGLVARFLRLLPPFTSYPLVQVFKVRNAQDVRVAVQFLYHDSGGRRAVGVLDRFFIQVNLWRVANAFCHFMRVNVVGDRATCFGNVAKVNNVSGIDVASYFLTFTRHREGHCFATNVRPLPPR